MALRHRNGNWHYRFMYQNINHSGDTGWAATERNRRQAEAHEAEVWRKVATGQAATLKPEHVAFAAAADAFLESCKIKHSATPNTWKRVRGSFTSLKMFFKNKAVATITRADTIAYSEWRSRDSVKPVTIRHDFHALSKFFKYAKIMGWCQASPIDAEDIPSDKDAVRANLIPVDAVDEEAAYFTMVKARFPQLHDLERIMLLQGCRPEELSVIEKDHVDLEGGFLRIVKGKTAAARRTLALDPEAVEILTRLKAEAKGNYLFHAERNPLKPLSMSTIETQQARLGVKYVVYDFRHMFATRAANDGMSLHALAKILGHSDLRSVMRYVHPSQADMDNSMRALIEARRLGHNFRNKIGPYLDRKKSAGCN